MFVLSVSELVKTKKSWPRVSIWRTASSGVIGLRGMPLSLTMDGARSSASCSSVVGVRSALGWAWVRSIRFPWYLDICLWTLATAMSTAMYMSRSRPTALMTPLLPKMFISATWFWRMLGFFSTSRVTSISRTSRPSFWILDTLSTACSRNASVTSMFFPLTLICKTDPPG